MNCLTFISSRFPSFVPSGQTWLKVKTTGADSGLHSLLFCRLLRPDWKLFLMRSSVSGEEDWDLWESARCLAAASALGRWVEAAETRDSTMDNRENGEKMGINFFAKETLPLPYVDFQKVIQLQVWISGSKSSEVSWAILRIPPLWAIRAIWAILTYECGDWLMSN